MIFEKGNKITTNNRNCFVIKNAENGFITFIKASSIFFR